MAQLAHTPGPWEESGSRNVIRTKTYANERGGLSGGEIVAQFWTTPTDADARLMAAAPELLAALDEIVDALHSGYVPEIDGEILAGARAALSKAEGRL